jgi:TonB family protein
VIAALLATVLAVSAIHDTTSVLPGTTIHLGAESARFGAAQGFQPSPRPQPPDRLEREGTMRFFGIDATATLIFLERRLVQAEFVIEKASPHQFAYIGDDLTRRGYRRECVTLTRENSDCTWWGENSVAITRTGSSIRATIRPLARPVRPEPPPAATMPMHPDTLTFPSGWARADFLTPDGRTPVYPRAARDAGVQGIVRTLATVDTSGTVIDVRIERGIAELDSAAIDYVRGLRFRRFVHQDRSVGAWVRVPITFTLYP